MPIVKMPDGANVSFPADMPADQIRGMILQKFPDAGKAAAPDKGGFVSELGKAINPVEMARETGRQASEGMQKVQDVFGKGGRGDVSDTSPYNPVQGWDKTLAALGGAGQALHRLSSVPLQSSRTLHDGL